MKQTKCAWKNDNFLRSIVALFSFLFVSHIYFQIFTTIKFREKQNSYIRDVDKYVCSRQLLLI